MDERTPCAECGMPVTSKEYHPSAACLMYRGCWDAAEVTMNLLDVVAYAKRKGAEELEAATAAKEQKP